MFSEQVSWTEALRTIVKNCYKHHGREDLLHVFSEEASMSAPQTTHFPGTVVQTINNPDGTVSIIHIDTGPSGSSVVTLPDGTQATVVQAVSARYQVRNAMFTTCMSDTHDMGYSVVCIMHELCNVKLFRLVPLCTSL